MERARAGKSRWLSGAAMLVRRRAVEQVGGLDESFFMFNEESDWQYRMHEAGWEVVFFPGAEVVHVGGDATKRDWSRMFTTQVRSHVRFVRKHQGAGAAAFTRALLVAALVLRGLLFRGERGRSYRRAARGLLRP